MLEKVRIFARKNAIAIFLAFAPPIALWYFAQRERREVTVSLRAAFPVVSLKSELSKGVKIFCGDKPVRSLNAYEVEIRNTGNKPIERSDFDTALSVDFAGNLLDGPEILKSYPATVQPNFKADASTVVLESMLLNAGDYFSFRIRAINEPSINNSLKVNGRIVGAHINTKGLDGPESVREARNAAWRPWLVSATILVSLVSLITLARRARRLTLSLPIGEARRLSDSLASEDVAEDSKSLAESLGVQRYDKKGSLLAIRIALQKALWRMAEEADIQCVPGKEAITSLAEELQKGGMLNQEIATAIRDLVPVLNGEIDSPDSYLTDREFDEISRLGLSVAVHLQRKIQRRSRRARLLSDLMIKGRTDEECFDGQILDYSIDGSGLCIETEMRIPPGARVLLFIASRELPAISVWNRITAEGKCLVAFEVTSPSSGWVRRVETLKLPRAVTPQS